MNYQCSKDTIQRQQSISKILRIDLDQFDERDILYDKSKIKDKLILDDRGLSTIFTMSKNVQDTSYPSDISGSEKLAELDQAMVSDLGHYIFSHFSTFEYFSRIFELNLDF